MSAREQTNGGEQTKSDGQAPAGEHRAEAIARLAYDKWQARGCPADDDRRDWFEAEQEIVAPQGTQAVAAERSRSRKRA